MNKARRNELRQLKFKRRLKNLGLKQTSPRDYVCYKDQGKPCSCKMCSPRKYSRSKTKSDHLQG